MKSKWTKWKRVKKKRIDYYGNIFQVEREYGESLSIKGSDSVDNRDLLNIAFNIARIPRASARQSNEYTGDKTFLWTNIKPWVAVGSHQSFSGWARSIGREAAERERERESLEKVKSSFMQGTPLQSEEHLLPGWARQARRVSRAWDNTT